MTGIFIVVMVAANAVFLLLPKPECWPAAVVADLAFVCWAVLIRNYGLACGAAACLAFSLRQWWKHRKTPKRKARDLLGAKSKAARDKLVRTMRGRAVPGRPAPARE